MMAAFPSVSGSITASGLMLSGRKSEEIADLIDLFSKTQYRAKEVTPRVATIEKRCLELFGRDYKYSVIHNANGEVCGHYPRQMVFLEYECTELHKEGFESTVQITKLQDLVNRSKMARCRGRFVCPVILYNGKHICRNGDSQLFDKVRGLDIKLLRYLSVRYICDLMVENKKVKFGLNVTSSEKVDKAQRYADFTLLSVPYPDESGLLVHCISGWDRTPLFVSLLRLSLWADGAVHASLEPAEILYLTIAYDWFLFGHMLPDRLSKGEEIFFFCFNFLKHIVSEKFSAMKKQRDRGSVTSLSSDFSLITEDAGGATCLTNDAVDLFSGQPLGASSWRKGHTSSPQTVLWNRPNPLQERLAHPLSQEAKSSSSSSSNQSEPGFTRAGSSPMSVPGSSPMSVPGRRLGAEYARSGSSLSTDYGSWQIVSGCGSIHDHGQCPSPSERQARLEAVREVFLVAYSSTVGLKSSAPSPSGAISGLLEQFARGVRSAVRTSPSLIFTVELCMSKKKNYVACVHLVGARTYVSRSVARSQYKNCAALMSVTLHCPATSLVCPAVPHDQLVWCVQPVPHDQLVWCVQPVPHDQLVWCVQPVPHDQLVWCVQPVPHDKLVWCVQQVPHDQLVWCVQQVPHDQLVWCVQQVPHDQLVWCVQPVPHDKLVWCVHKYPMTSLSLVVWGVQPVPHDKLVWCVQHRTP
ncbi:unnamed protein product [Coregonus sp. 'balchen']|nr:unnamed protein product [Coregonus sp. 'balchen']